MCGGGLGVVVGCGGGFVNFEGIFSFYEFKVSLKYLELIFNGRTPARMLSEGWHSLAFFPF